MACQRVPRAVAPAPLARAVGQLPRLGAGGAATRESAAPLGLGGCSLRPCRGGGRRGGHLRAGAAAGGRGRRLSAGDEAAAGIGGGGPARGKARGRLPRAPGRTRCPTLRAPVLCGQVARGGWPPRDGAPAAAEGEHCPGRARGSCCRRAPESGVRPRPDALERTPAGRSRCGIRGLAEGAGGADPTGSLPCCCANHLRGEARGTAFGGRRRRPARRAAGVAAHGGPTELPPSGHHGGG
mmetsp:Transcript_94460/g.281975  ORF Transcript_94460/g.281975 Transcript_94460/m.281975 type:complete len:239 (-) Transcript_94460:755-1471(-)